MNAILRVAVALVLGAAALIAQAEDYPSKPLRFIIPYPPGGIADLFARALGQQLGERLTQQVVPENKPGGSLIIGAEAAARAPADGYTIFLGSVSSLAINAGAFKKLPYDPVKDFSPITIAFYTPLYLITSPDLPATSVRELIVHARANPGALSFASLGVGSSLHLAGEMFKTMAGIDIVHVPYKGTTTAYPDLISGRVQMIFDGGAFLSQAKAGKVRMLAVTSSRRVGFLPEVPTMAEAGVPGYDLVIWFGVVAPAGTPGPVIDRLSREVAEIVALPTFKERFAQSGMELVSNTPEAFGQLIRNDIQKWTRLLKDAGVQPQ
jgi:tripartite-type tricarboxylate transporter receptor subunit TctC